MSEWRRLVMPLLHPGRLPHRRGRLGVVIIVALFVGAGALGIAVASQHGGIGPTAATFDVSISDSHMTPSSLHVRAGDQVVLSIIADRSETLLLQGYDQHFQLAAGVAVVGSFVAAKAGTFNFVINGSGTAIGQLEVTG